MKIYVAGPMRGYPQFNFPAFFAAEEQLKSQGHHVFNPARSDQDEHGDFWKESKTGDLSEVPEFNLRETLAFDLDWVCKNADAVYMLPGWSRSKGAVAERAAMEAVGGQVLYAEGAEHLPPTYICLNIHKRS